MERRRLSAHEFFHAEELFEDAELSGEELASAFWRVRRLSHDFNQQVTFWRATNDSMSEAYEKLASYEERIRVQEETIRSLGTPILRVWKGVLALPLVGHLNEERASAITRELLQAVCEEGIVYAILDLTGVEDVDDRTVAYISDISRSVALLGARCLLCGMPARLARSLSTLGAELGELKCFASLHATLRHVFADKAFR